MLQQWYPEYQERIQSALEILFTSRSSGKTHLEGEFESALRYAVEG